MTHGKSTRKSRQLTPARAASGTVGAVAVLLAVISAATLTSCSHSPTHRSPASDPSQLKKYSVNFTLIRDPEIDKVVRVYHGTPNSKPLRLEISNPGGQVACQNGAPARVDAPPSQSGAYTLETHADQDVFCYLGPSSPPVTSIQVDYFYATAASNAKAEPEQPAPGSDLMLKALRDLQNNEYSPETLSVLQAHNLVSTFTLFARPDDEPFASTPKEKIHEPLRSLNLVPGDLLVIKSVTGKLGATRAMLEKAPYLPDGLPKPVAQPKKTEPLAAQAVTHDASYLYPDERPRRLICTLQEKGGEPKVVYRGGEDLLATREARGDFHCHVNLKTRAPEKLQGNFTVSALVVKHDDAVSELQALTRSGDQGKGARDQQAEDELFAQIRSDAAGLLVPDISLVQRYNRLIATRAKSGKSDRLEPIQDLAAVEAFFPESVTLNYRPGPYTFQIVPVKRTLPTTQGNVDYMDLTLQNGETPYYPENKAHPIVTATDNLFAPIQYFASAERWTQSIQEPWQVVICPDKIAEATAAFNKMAAENLRGIMSTRQSVWLMTSKFGARNASDCDPNWFDTNIRGMHPVYEPMYFQRQSRFRFTYVKAALPLLDGRDIKRLTVYNPDHIEGLYASPSGAALSRIFTHDNNAARGPDNGHPFFTKGRATETPYEKSSALPSEIQIDTRTLFPPMGPGGIIENASAE